MSDRREEWKCGECGEWVSGECYAHSHAPKRGLASAQFDPYATDIEVKCEITRYIRKRSDPVRPIP
jgi:hypothetical protein